MKQRPQGSIEVARIVAEELVVIAARRARRARRAVGPSMPPLVCAGVVERDR